jgi:HD superfamily phosphodiesterase
MRRLYRGCGYTHPWRASLPDLIRVILCAKTISEPDAALMARKIRRKIRRKIEDELQFPGIIKVTVVRENRFEETAK